jgi:hypothetical protein
MRLPAAAAARLAASMPAAYSSVLEQAGCSREVGLLLAFEVSESRKFECGNKDGGNSLSQQQMRAWAAEMVADGVSICETLSRGLTRTS